jgi:hypothetical protein
MTARDLEVVQAEWKRDCETCSGEGEYEHPHMPLHHLHSESPEYAVVKCPDCDGVGWNWTDAMISLAECPIGLFWTECGSLCLKTEYGNNEGRIDAYIVSSGEFFWGHAPQTIPRQRAALVKPIDCDNATARLAHQPPAACEAALEMAYKEGHLRGRAGGSALEVHDDWLRSAALSSAPVAPVGEGQSTCNRCGEQYRTAPPGYLHKCGKCPGVCYPNTPKAATQPLPGQG